MKGGECSQPSAESTESTILTQKRKRTITRKPQVNFMEPLGLDVVVVLISVVVVLISVAVVETILVETILVETILVQVGNGAAVVVVPGHGINPVDPG